MSRRKGDTFPAKLGRQHLVCRLFLRGLTVPEVARQLGVTERTIQLDFQEIKVDLFQVIQTRELRTLKLALRELEELWREAWTLYHRPAQQIQTKQGIATLDDRPIKAMLLTDLLRISAEKNRLLIPTNAKETEQKGAREVDGLRLAVEIIESLPGRTQQEIIAYLRSQLKGVRIERLTFEEQLARGVERLKNDPGLARAEGIPEEFIDQGNP